MKSPEMQPSLIEAGQNALNITIDGRNIVVPRKKLYGVPDIGKAIGSDNPGYIRDKLWRARKKNPDINLQYLGIGQRRTALFLPEKDFVLAVTTIIPTIEGGWGSHQKESITLPDRQTITVRGEEQKRTLRLLINAFNQGKPYVPNEELLDFDITKGIPLSLIQTNRLSQTLSRLNKTLTRTGWGTQSITVNGKSVEIGSRGYCLKKDRAQKADDPTSYLQSVLDNKTILKELLTNGHGKTSILEKAKQQINSLDPQEKIIFLEKTFAILSDSDPGNQNKRDAALDILSVIDLTSVNPKKLEESYRKAVHYLSEGVIKDYDPYGEIHMLLEAGKIISPFIENSRHIIQAWKRVAKVFIGSDRQKILADIEQIGKLTPARVSEFDAKVLTHAQKGLRSIEIAIELSVPIEDIRRSKNRLEKKGIRFKPFNRTKR